MRLGNWVFFVFTIYLPVRELGIFLYYYFPVGDWVFFVFLLSGYELSILCILLSGSPPLSPPIPFPTNGTKLGSQWDEFRFREKGKLGNCCGFVKTRNFACFFVKLM
jgi:hypothetical protein